MIHTYFVCYEGDGGVDNAEVDRDAPITTMADVRAIEKSLNIPMGGVRSWQLLRSDPTRPGRARFVFMSNLDTHDVEDGGQAFVRDVDEMVEGADVSPDVGLWLALRSWDPERRHAQWRTLAGHRVRITVEVVDEGQ